MGRKIRATNNWPLRGVAVRRGFTVSRIINMKDIGNYGGNIIQKKQKEGIESVSQDPTVFYTTPTVIKTPNLKNPPTQKDSKFNTQTSWTPSLINPLTQEDSKFNGETSRETQQLEKTEVTNITNTETRQITQRTMTWNCTQVSYCGLVG
ncbi:hypothetical protein AVEN_172015-1 [Araneus ventricosus]|uniref:Uncharacterized protein n=1 Tax=Araneus ventricosus TaxID=182803 RepID=A0A4Y2LDW7_ARAVE|nr:hypothetical protein AVEN_172015-1 [Araneus ventricosus]